MKRIFLISLVLIILLSLSAVQATENMTNMQTVIDDATQDIEPLSDTQNSEILSNNTDSKEDLPIELKCADYIVKPDPSEDVWRFNIENVPKDYKEPVSVHIDDELIFNDTPYEKWSGKYQLNFDNINLKNFDIGKHVILAQFPGNDKYNHLNLTHEFEIGEGYIEIPNEVKSTEHVYAHLKQGATGNLTVFVDGNEFAKVKIIASPFEGGFAYVFLNNLTKGTHFVEALYSGDENPKKIYKNATVNLMMNSSNEIKTFNDIQLQIYQSKENDTIELNGTYLSLGKKIFIDKSLTIKGNNNTILDANKIPRIFDVKEGNVIFKDLKFINAYSCKMIKSGYWFEHNSTIFSYDFITLINCTFENNTGTLIKCNNMSCIDCTFKNNVADNNLIDLYDDTGVDIVNPKEIMGAYFNNTNFINNTINTNKPFDRYLIDLSNEALYIYNCNFLNNSNCLDSYGYTSIINSTFENNNLAGYLQGDLEIINSHFINNNEGALKLEWWKNVLQDLGDHMIADNTIINSSFKNNKGCAIYSNNTLKITNSIFENNTDRDAGAIILAGWDHPTAELNNCTFKNNSIHAIHLIPSYSYNQPIFINGESFDKEFLDDKTTKTINITVDYSMPIVLTLGFEYENITYKYSYYNAFGEEVSGFDNKTMLELNSSIFEKTGNYTINVNVTNKYLFKKELIYNIQIIKASTNITANAEDINCTEIATINITGSVDGTAIVKIDENNTKTINITKNTTTPVTFENLTAGTHSVSVVLKPSNDNYNESTCNTEFKVSKKQAAINIACEEKIVEGSTLTVNITIPNATGKVKVNGKETNLVNGKATVELTDLALGDNTITAIYNGDDIYTNATASSKVNVYPKADANLKVSASDIQVGETAVINIEINAKTTGDVTVDGKKVTVNNGKATYSITDLKEGNYKVIVKFAGDKYYKQAEKTVAFKVNALPSIEPKIVSKNITTVLYTAKGKYTVTVYGKDGKPANGTEVIFEIKGKQDKKTTDSNGVAKYTVTRTPGTYDITTTALGVSITKTLKVKHLVTLKKVTPKKSAKKLTLQATLAKVNGKYLKGKTITFKFNGKKYKAKTNSKGIAKYTIKSTILKKLKVGKKITYQATYLKDTVKQTVKVKK